MPHSIPESVSNNAKRGLELREKLGRGGTSVGMGSARTLAAGGEASDAFVRKVNAYFPRHAGDNLNDKQSNGWVAWLLWGGNAGRSWAAAAVKSMESSS